MISLENRKAVIGFSVGIVLFWLVKKYFLESKEKEEQIFQPEINDHDIDVALEAFSNALQANEPQSVLNELNMEFADQYGFRIYQRKKDGRYVVTDLSGKEVKII